MRCDDCRWRRRDTDGGVPFYYCGKGEDIVEVEELDECEEFNMRPYEED